MCNIVKILITGGNWNNAGNTGVSNWNSNNDTSKSDMNISAHPKLIDILNISEQHICPNSLNELNILLFPGSESNKFVNSLLERRM
jgi:hypothetical protein